MSDTTVVIKTIGRGSLRAAVASAKREGFSTLVVADGVDVEDVGADKAVKLGRPFGYYGGMCANVGAALVETEFITFLDDDDEFIVGAGKVIRKKLKEKPEVDIWIAGVRFNEEVAMLNQYTGAVTYRGTDLAIWPEKGVAQGNVAMPTFRTKVFEISPFLNTMKPEFANLTDLVHVTACQQNGFKIDWFGEALYLVRPSKKHVKGLDSVNGRGK